MNILQEMFAIYHHCTYSNHLLTYFIKKEKSSVAKWAMKPNRAYGPLICYTLLSHMQFAVQISYTGTT